MVMDCSLNNQQDDYPITEELHKLLLRVLEIAAELEQVDPGAEVGLTLVDDETIRAINKEYRGIDAPTDVIAFAMGDKSPEEPAYDDPLEGRLLGDIIISVPTAVKQAEAYGHTVERELAFLAVHGFLHLIGYDDNNDHALEVMKKRQEDVLVRVGLSM